MFKHLCDIFQNMKKQTEKEQIEYYRSAYRIVLIGLVIQTIILVVLKIESSPSGETTLDLSTYLLQVQVLLRLFPCNILQCEVFAQGIF